MSKQLLISIVLWSTVTGLEAQRYYYNANLRAGSNPEGLNTDLEKQPPPSGWSPILSSGATTWSTVQTIPFVFKFNGIYLNEYKVSPTGVLTFDAAASTVPNSTNTTLPATDIPDYSVCVWGLTLSGADDAVLTKTFGTAPNRQHWVQWSSATDPSLTGTRWTYWAIVFEESTNKVYVVDQRTYSSSGNNVTLTIGIQISANLAIQVAGSPSIGSGTLADGYWKDTSTDNGYWEFLYGPACNRYFERSWVNTLDLEADYYGQLYWEQHPRNYIVGNLKTTTSSPLTEPEELLILDWTEPYPWDYASLWSVCGNAVVKKIWSKVNYPGPSAMFGVWYANFSVDQYVVGDFTGDGQDDLLCVNDQNGHAQLVTYTAQNDFCSGQANFSASDWTYLWGNLGSDFIGVWNLSPTDSYFAGDFDGDGADELLCTSSNGFWQLYDFFGGGWVYKWGATVLTPLFEGWFPTAWIQPNLTAIGKFIKPNPLSPESERDMIFMFHDGSPDQYVVAYYVEGQGFLPYFRNCGVKQIGATNIGNGRFMTGQFDGDPQDELIWYSRKWRFEMTTSDFMGSWDNNCDDPGMSNFVTNGRIDFSGYTNDHNPKYFERVVPVIGRFLGDQPSALLMFYTNNDPNYNWKENAHFYTPESGVNWKTSTPEETRSLRFLIAPNPADRLVIIRSNATIQVPITSISVVDVAGRSVMLKEGPEPNIGQSQVSIDVSSLSSGLYFLIIQTLAGTYTEKIVIQ